MIIFVKLNKEIRDCLMVIYKRHYEMLTYFFQKKEKEFKYLFLEGKIGLSIIIVSE